MDLKRNFEFLSSANRLESFQYEDVEIHWTVGNGENVCDDGQRV